MSDSLTTLTHGRLDELLSKPFGWLVRQWCHHTGKTASQLACITAIPWLLFTLVADFIGDGSWAGRGLYLGATMLAMVFTFMVFIPRWRDMEGQAMSDALPAPLLVHVSTVRIWRFIQVIFLPTWFLESTKHYPLKFNLEMGVFGSIGSVFAILTFYALSTLSQPGTPSWARFKAFRLAEVGTR